MQALCDESLFCLGSKRACEAGPVALLCGEDREREARRSTLPEPMIPFCPGKRNFTLQLKDEIFLGLEAQQ